MTINNPLEGMFLGDFARCIMPLAPALDKAIFSSKSETGMLHSSLAAISLINV